MGMKKLIFDVKNFFGSRYFLVFFPDLMDQKMARGAKKVVRIKSQFFHAHQSLKEISEIHSHRSCVVGETVTWNWG